MNARQGPRDQLSDGVGTRAKGHQAHFLNAGSDDGWHQDLGRLLGTCVLSNGAQQSHARNGDASSDPGLCGFGKERQERPEYESAESSEAEVGDRNQHRALSRTPRIANETALVDDCRLQRAEIICDGLSVLGRGHGRLLTQQLDPVVELVASRLQRLVR